VQPNITLGINSRRADLMPLLGEIGMTYADKIWTDIREAFTLLKEAGGYKYGDVDLNKAIIVTSYLSELQLTEILGMPIYNCDLQSSFDYFICIQDPSEAEKQFLRFHREAMGCLSRGEL